ACDVARTDEVSAPEYDRIPMASAEMVSSMSATTGAAANRRYARYTGGRAELPEERSLGRTLRKTRAARPDAPSTNRMGNSSTSTASWGGCAAPRGWTLRWRTSWGEAAATTTTGIPHGALATASPRTRPRPGSVSRRAADAATTVRKATAAAHVHVTCHSAAD